MNLRLLAPKASALPTAPHLALTIIRGETIIVNYWHLTIVIDVPYNHVAPFRAEGPLAQLVRAAGS